MPEARAPDSSDSRLDPTKLARFRKIAGLIGLTILLVGMMLLDIFLDRRFDLYPDKLYVPEFDIVVNRPNLVRVASAKRWNPNSKHPDQPESFSYPIFIDADGARTEKNPPPYDRETPVVAVLGDSFSFGFQAAHEDTFAGRLQTAFPRCKVFNFAVAGTCSRDFPLTLKYFLAKKGPLKLKGVLVSLFVDPETGDVARMLAREHRGSYKEIGGYYIGPNNYKSIHPSEWAQARFITEMYLRCHSSLFNLLMPPAANLNEFYEGLPEKYPEDLVALILGLELSRLEQIREISGLPSSSIVVQLMPTAAETHALLAKKKKGIDFPWPSAWALWDRFRDEARAKGYVVMDNREMFAERIGALEHLSYLHKPLPFACDSHMTATGFEWLSQSLEDPLGQIMTKP